MMDRRDGFIQELRGLAVLLVVVYHFFDEMLPFGYLGVDIFFAISGFVITKSLISRGAYSYSGLVSFYTRRAKRLLPSLNFVILLTLVCALVLFSPKLQRSIAIESVAAVFAVSNLYFYTTIDYFSSSAIYRPLLHTWSLGVEEQVYLLFPLILAAALGRFSKANKFFLVLLVAALTALSFYLFIYLNLDGRESRAFYSPFARFWQFGLGALVALSGVRSALGLKKSSGLFHLSLVFLLSGFILSIGRLTTADYEQVYLFSVFVSLSMVFIFIFSSGASHLGMLRVIGDRSYSLYLCHWPVFVVLSYVNAYVVAVYVEVSAIVLTVLLGEITYRVFERNYQERRYLGRLLVCLMLFNCSMALGIYSVADSQRARMTSLELRAPCLLDANKGLSIRRSVGCIAFEDVTDTVVLWGSSHLAHYEPFISMSHEPDSVSKLLTQGCPPVVGFGSDNCQRFNDVVLSYMADVGEGLVVLGANWENHSAEPGFRASLRETLLSLNRMGWEVVMIGQVPTFAVDVPSYVFQNPKVQYVTTLSSSLLQVELNAIAKSANAKFIDVMSASCVEGRCLVQVDNTSLYEDETHLSEFGARWILRNVDI